MGERTSCDECGTPFPPHMDIEALPPEMDCPSCHGEPDLADIVIENRLRWRALAAPSEREEGEP